MRIGIDAKYYYSGPPSSVNVVRNLVDNFIKFNNGDQIVFFLSNKDIQFREDFKKLIENKENLSFTFIPGQYNFLTNLLLFPLYLYKKGIDAVLFQNYVPIWGGRKIKYIDYVHDFLFFDYPQYFTGIQRFIFRWMRFSAIKAHHVITISQSERSRIIRHSNISPDKISYVYHGLDTIFYERSEDIKAKIKQKFDLPDSFILYIGRINIRKNIITLLKGFYKLNHNISLVILGKEDNSGFSLTKEITRLGIADKVKIIGYVPDKDLGEIISAATIFVFPSYAEGFGLPPLEAMKSGVPTIVSNTTSLPEVCGDAALYFDPDDCSELVLKMKLLLMNPEAYSSLKLKGIHRSKNFVWQKSVEDILKIINEACQ